MKSHRPTQQFYQERRDELLHIPRFPSRLEDPCRSTTTMMMMVVVGAGGGGWAGAGRRSNPYMLFAFRHPKSATCVFVYDVEIFSAEVLDPGSAARNWMSDVFSSTSSGCSCLSFSFFFFFLVREFRRCRRLIYQGLLFRRMGSKVKPHDGPEADIIYSSPVCLSPIARRRLRR